MGSYTLTLSRATGLRFNRAAWERFQRFLTAVRYVETHLGKNPYRAAAGRAPLGADRRMLPGESALAAFSKRFRMEEEFGWFAGARCEGQTQRSTSRSVP